MSLIVPLALAAANGPSGAFGENDLSRQKGQLGPLLRQLYIGEVDPGEYDLRAGDEALSQQSADRQQGVADVLSRALLEERPEDLAVLLVDVKHPRVQALYEDWGFRKIGARQPFPDSPLYAVMLADLPLSS